MSDTSSPHLTNCTLELYLVYGLCLQNLNTFSQNVEGIDLIDNVNKLIVQVSSTSTKKKIDSTLSKESLSNINQDINVNSFEIEKKIRFNDLDMTEMMINESIEFRYCYIENIEVVIYKYYNLIICKYYIH